MEYRRRAPRQPTAWTGFCHIDGEPAAMWRDCEVIDVSMFGLGLTFIHPQPWELAHRRIFVDISAIGDAVNIRLEGEIRDAAFTLEGDIRVGVELVGLSPAELAITAVLGGINKDDMKDVAPRLAR
ncbi:MAG TPA: PilZ domain-containing protein [Acidimicrobiales bacterium]